MILQCGGLCSGEHVKDAKLTKAPVVVVVIGGGYSTLFAAYEAVEVDIPVLVFAGSGGAADFIAAAYNRREKPLVLCVTVCFYVFNGQLTRNNKIM